METSDIYDLESDLYITLYFSTPIYIIIYFYN